MCHKRLRSLEAQKLFTKGTARDSKIRILIIVLAVNTSTIGRVELHNMSGAQTRLTADRRAIKDRNSDPANTYIRTPSEISQGRVNVLHWEACRNIV